MHNTISLEFGGQATLNNGDFYFTTFPQLCNNFLQIGNWHFRRKTSRLRLFVRLHLDLCRYSWPLHEHHGLDGSLGPCRLVHLVPVEQRHHRDLLVRNPIQSHVPSMGTVCVQPNHCKRRSYGAHWHPHWALVLLLDVHISPRLWRSKPTVNSPIFAQLVSKPFWRHLRSSSKCPSSK